MWRVVILSLVVACNAEKRPCKICPGSGPTRENLYLEMGADHHDKLIMQMEGQLAQLQERYNGLENVSDVEDLSDRVQGLVGTGCDFDEYQCGGDHPMCVSQLLVCDDINDCDNGEDEHALCQAPGEVGSSWGGLVMWVGCGFTGSGHVYIVITDIDRPNYLASVMNVQAQVIYEGNHETKTVAVSGTYCYAHHVITLSAESGGIHLECDLDKGNQHCVGKLTRGNIDELCAEINLVHH